MLTDRLIAGPEVLTNSVLAGRQEITGLSHLSAGGLVAVWVTFGENSRVSARLFDDAGNPTGPEFQVNTSDSWTYGYPGVAPFPDGGFVTIWDPDEILAQRFDRHGTPIGDELVVSAANGGSITLPSIAPLEDGNFAMTWRWEAGPDDLDQGGIYLQRFSGTGQRVGDRTLVNSTTAGDQSRPTIAGLSEGGYVASWTSSSDDRATGYDIYGQRFAPTGAALGPEFRVNTTIEEWQEASAVAGLADRGFVIVWHSWQGDGDRAGIFGQRFDGDGTARGAEFQVNTYTDGPQRWPRITETADGGFVVAWQSFEQDGDEEGIYAQRFDAFGARIGTELRLNDQTAFSQFLGDIDMLPDGSIAAGWSSYRSQNDSDIYSRRYGPELWGTEEADTLIDPGASAYLNGRGGDDEVSGGPGDNIILGGSGSDTLHGEDGDDLLDGGAGADTIDGGPGGDRMVGGDGNDTYLVDDRGDRIHEAAGGGSDIIRASGRFNLRDAEIEEVAFDGTSRQQIVGNEFATRFVGNDRVNILVGGGGGDTLEGGGGADYFAFQLGDAPGAARVVDFQEGDQLALDDRLFGLGDERVDPRQVTQRQIEAALANGSARYERATGELTLDVDGTRGPNAPEIIAIFETTPRLNVDDILLF